VELEEDARHQSRRSQSAARREISGVLIEGTPTAEFTDGTDGFLPILETTPLSGLKVWNLERTMKALTPFKILSLAGLCLAPPVQAANVLVNGDFETGDFTGWKLGAAATIDSQTPLAGSHSALLPNDPNPPAQPLKLYQSFTAQTEPVTVEFTFAMTAPNVRGLQVMLSEQGGIGFINLQVTDLDNDGDGDVQIYHSPSRRFETVLKDAVAFGSAQTCSLTFNGFSAGLNYNLTVGDKSAADLSFYQNQAPNNLGQLSFVNEYSNTGYEIDNVRVDVPPVPERSIWDHLSSVEQLVDVRHMTARLDMTRDGRALKLEASDLNAKGAHAWIAIPPPVGGWILERVKNVRARVTNTGSKPVETTLWVVSANGWAAVGGAATLQPNETRTLSCRLRESYPDGTPKIDPGRIQQIRIMVQRAKSASLTVTGLVASGMATKWVRPDGRLEIPDMTDGSPAPGRRVRYRLAADAKNEIYCALYLPPDWKPGKRYPVIAEFPGNIFYSAKACWSTGRPEQCQMGYGMSSGTGAIWVSLPFVDRKNEEIAESGFGSNKGEDTTAHTLAVIKDICRNWGGDRENLFLCGFSRGSIACGYIGLRNDKISKLWKGIVGCQHYDGSNWRESNMEDAVQRAPRFSGKAIFQVDNSQEKYQPVVDATDPSVKWTWTRSALGYHATAMFLDDRPAMKQLRPWFRNLVEKR
jgi:hypothetical protein